MHPTRNAFLIYPVLLLAGLLCPQAQADTVVLKNGKKFEGIVTKENSSEITINIGLGSISFKRDQIATVEHSEQQVIEENWQRELITRGRFVPHGLNDFADKFATLESLRNSAVLATTENAGIQRRKTELFNEINTIQDQITQIAIQFQAALPENNLQTYNNLVKQQNRLATRAMLLKNTIGKDDEKTSANRDAISAYMQQLDDFKKDLAVKKSPANRQDPEIDRRTLEFFSSLDQRIKKYSTEFQQIDVPHHGDRNHMLVSVRLNDRIDGTFLLDTGATYVTLSSEMAKNLGIGLSGKNNVTVSLANGSNVSAQAVILESMQTGNARVNGVIAMVFPEPPHPGVDGLLGMSFLREFTIQLDPVNKKLVFQQFSPN